MIAARENVEIWLRARGWSERDDERRADVKHWSRAGYVVTTGDDAELLCSALLLVAEAALDRVDELEDLLRLARETR